MSSLLTPIGAFNAAEALLWFGFSCMMSILLRSLALRTRIGGVLEIIFVAAAFIITLSAHRNGMIHRPFFIGDYALIRGIDPATILMGIGCFAVVAMSALLMAENDQRRLPYHFVVIALLCSSLAGYVQLFGLPTPGVTDDMGLTGQELSGNSRQRENPFRDGENTAEDKQAPVAVVVFRDDYEPLNGSYYFRESAYSQFNGVMLDYSSRDDMDLDLISTFTNTEVSATLLPEAEEHHKEVKTTVGMLIPHRNPFGLESPVTYSSTTNPNASRFRRTYDTVSWAPTYNFEFLLGRKPEMKAGQMRFGQNICSYRMIHVIKSWLNQSLPSLNRNMPVTRLPKPGRLRLIWTKMASIASRTITPMRKIPLHHFCSVI